MEAWRLLGVLLQRLHFVLADSGGKNGLDNGTGDGDGRRVSGSPANRDSGRRGSIFGGDDGKPCIRYKRATARFRANSTPRGAAA